MISCCVEGIAARTSAGQHRADHRDIHVADHVLGHRRRSRRELRLHRHPAQPKDWKHIGRGGDPGPCLTPRYSRDRSHQLHSAAVSQSISHPPRIDFGDREHLRPGGMQTGLQRAQVASRGSSCSRCAEFDSVVVGLAATQSSAELAVAP
jgi:hypothetical protein